MIDDLYLLWRGTISHVTCGLAPRPRPPYYDTHRWNPESFKREAILDSVNERPVALMAEPTKQEIAQVFKRLRAVGPNKVHSP